MSALSVAIIASTLRLSAPLILAAMGGIISERSGVANIALEGMMLIGAFAGIAFAATFGTAAGVIAAMAAGALLGLLHAAATQKLRVGAIISGVAVNILAAGVTSYLARTDMMREAAGANVGVGDWTLPFASSAPEAVRPLLTQSPFTWFAWLSVLLMAFFLWKTPWGLRVTASGENPEAVKAAGINVARLRFGTLAVSGILAALGGAQLSLGQVHNFSENMTAGRGFIALAAVVFGRWRPFGAFAAALFFAFADALQTGLQTVPGVSSHVRSEFMAMTPYVATLIALVFFSKRVKAPAAL